jgi:hypothetical protein
MVTSTLTGNSGGIVLQEWTLNGTIEGVNITPDGRLGLGVSNPVQALEVAGSAIVNGTLSAGNPLMFRNAIINGDMRINQRGISTNWASPTAVSTSGTAASCYTLDRWLLFRTGAGAGAALAQVATTTTDFPFTDAGLQWYMRVGRTVGSTITTSINICYSLESRDSFRFCGKPATVSFYYRSGAAWAGTQYFNLVWSTGTDQNNIAGLTGYTTATTITLAAVNTTWRKYSFTGFIPLNATQVTLNFGYVPATATAVANDYFDITGVQLEAGSVATPFEVRPYATELALCQRYYWQWTTTTQHMLGFGFYQSAGPLAYASTNLPVPMRAAPTLSTQSAASTFQIIYYATTIAPSALSLSSQFTSNTSVLVNFTASGGTLANGIGVFAAGASGQTAYLGFSAEL